MSDASSHKPAPRPNGSSLFSEPAAAAGGSSASQPAFTGSDSGLSSEGKTVISSRSPTPDLPLGSELPGEAARLWEGEQLGQFVLQQFVGGGGMGIVFRAHDTTLDREVAVKVLSRDQSADEETLRRFRNEAQSAARLNHDNIARVFFVGEDRGVHYIVFEFIEGVNIRDLVDRQGALPLAQALSYTYQIALALDHACQRSVIHRDIKPSNVLVTPDGKAKLVDMGLARLNLMAQASNDLTASGVTLGTFDYISPEQARDPRSADVRSDLYSLGCSFYFMLTGRPPFPEGTVLQKLLQHQADTPPDPRSVRPELPVEVTRVLARLLAKNPSERYQEPIELIEALIMLGRSLGLALGDAPPPRAALPRTNREFTWLRHLPWVLPIAALFLIVLGLDYYWTRSEPSPTPLWTVREPARRPPRETPPLPVIEMPESTSEAEPDATSAETDADGSSGPLNRDSAGESSSGDAPSGLLPDASSEGSSQSDTATAGTSSPFFEFFDLVERWQREARAEQERRATTGGASDDVQIGSVVDPPPMPELDSSPAGEADDSILTVGDDSQENNYSSLLAACTAAKDGDTIELHFDGRRTERPLTISNIKLTIRAGSGYRPTVVFAPEPDRPFSGTQMVSVAGGQLTVRNVHWELDVPANSPIERSLFEAQHADLLDFEDCTFTVRAQPPYYAGVSFFDIKAPPGAIAMDMGGTSMGGHVVNIRLENCVARGEATLIHDADVQSVRLTWNDGLLAVSERLIVTEGSINQPRQESRAEITLRHVTAMVGSGLVLMTSSQEEPHQMVVDLRAQDCVLATSGSAPLVEQRGSAGIDEYLARFQWSGDTVYFRGFGTFWQVMNSAGPSGSKQLDFDDWRQRWQFTSRNQYDGDEAVSWSSPQSTSRPYHAQVASDYVLAPDSAAAAGASDGSDAGAPLPYLPVLASRSEPAEPMGSSARPMPSAASNEPMNMDPMNFEESP